VQVSYLFAGQSIRECTLCIFRITVLTQSNGPLIPFLWTICLFRGKCWQETIAWCNSCKYLNYPSCFCAILNSREILHGRLAIVLKNKVAQVK
jgi:hypothetical protein